MPCPLCHTEIEHPTPFCIDCGATLSGRRERLEPLNFGPTPVMRVRPVFRTSARLRAQTPIYLFLVMWCSFVVGGLSHLLVAGSSVQFALWTPYAIALVGLLASVPGIDLALARRAYAKTEFVFHAHRIDCIEGLFARRIYTVDLSDVQSVRIDAEAGAAHADLGTVLIATRDEAADSDGTIRIHNIRSASDVARQIRILIAASQASRPAIATAA